MTGRTTVAETEPDTVSGKTTGPDTVLAKITSFEAPPATPGQTIGARTKMATTRMTTPGQINGTDSKLIPR